MERKNLRLYLCLLSQCAVRDRLLHRSRFVALVLFGREHADVTGNPVFHGPYTNPTGKTEACLDLKTRRFAGLRGYTPRHPSVWTVACRKRAGSLPQSPASSIAVQLPLHMCCSCPSKREGRQHSQTTEVILTLTQVQGSSKYQ